MVIYFFKAILEEGWQWGMLLCIDAPCSTICNNKDFPIELPVGLAASQLQRFYIKVQIYIPIAA